MVTQSIHETCLNNAATFGLGEISVLHPPGTFALTAASLISIEAIGTHQQRLHGIGLDWGSGTGCLTVSAAKIPAVEKLLGLEISEANVEIARENAKRNGVDHKLTFMHADAYRPFSDDNQKILEQFKGRVNFILANPPSSENDDGFEYRRIVLRGAREYLQDGGIVFLSISYQYGLSRIKKLEQDVPGFSHEDVLTTTDWVPFDLGRPDLLHCLELYAQEETRGGLPYTFYNPAHPDEWMNAQTALALYHKTTKSPLSKWQTHLFRYQPS